MRRAHRKPWLLPVAAIYLTCGLCLIQPFHHGKHSNISLHSTGNEDERRPAGTPALRPPYRFYDLACEAAEAEGLNVEQYILNVAQLAEAFTRSKEVVGREGFAQAFRQAMLSKKFSLVLGGKNLGKTLMRNQTICKAEGEAQAKLTIIDVNMRAYPSKELYQAILERFGGKNSDWASILKNRLEKIASSAAGIVSATFVGSAEKVAPAAATPISSGVIALNDKLSGDQKEQTLSQLVDAALSQKGNHTSIVVDEANVALPGSDTQAAQRAMHNFVMLTKEQGKASVVLISSDLGYPYRLEASGLNLQDIESIIIVNEVSKSEILQLMVSRWDMSVDLADEFFTYFGGSIDLCRRALNKLEEDGEQFTPFCLLACPGLPTCAENLDSKKHLQNMVDAGWSPVYDVKNDAAARLIAQENVGAVVPRLATAFDLPEGIWEGQHEHALVPSGTLMKWKIAKELERVKSMSTGRTQPAVVWVRQLCEDGEQMKASGNAFQIKEDVNNVDDLKEAIKKKEQLSVAASKINVYRFQEGVWKQEAEDAELNHGKTTSDCYGYLLPGPSLL